MLRSWSGEMRTGGSRAASPARLPSFCIHVVRPLGVSNYIDSGLHFFFFFHPRPVTQRSDCATAAWLVAAEPSMCNQRPNSRGVRCIYICIPYHLNSQCGAYGWILQGDEVPGRKDNNTHGDPRSGPTKT